jgi:hypothetical protein
MTREKNDDLGKWAEGETQKWLTKRAESELGFAWHRMPDARSARGALAAQPGDFITARKVDGREPRTVWLEVKETAEERRFPRAKVAQWAKLRRFWIAGNDVIVLVYRSMFKDWTYLRARELFIYDGDEAPKSFPFEGRPTFPTHNEALDEIYK